MGCAATTIYNRAKISPAVRQCLLDEDGKIDDMAELKLYEKIMAGDMNAIKFRLSTKARHRGYGDKLEVKGEIISPVPMSEETKAELTRALAEAVLAQQEEPDDDADPDANLGPGDD